MPLGEWDAWSIWARKAEMLTGHDTQVTGFWAPDLGRTERLWPAIHDIAHQVGAPKRWQYLFALALLAILAALVSGIGRRVAAFYSGALLLAAVGFVWSYWISPNPIEWHLATSAPRVVTALLLIAFVALVHLCGLLLNAFLRQPREPVAQSSENL